MKAIIRRIDLLLAKEKGLEGISFKAFLFEYYQ